ncbi:hypothetical protein NQ318_011617 [Aromia moschata]|uniref:Uncharacterized protein n=1 Tax=Aromia moschata TaxID=1265417 RepID=A0AAV8Z746_9CUCU|nr:hypothetical protein NQ318_011617 [Aromia moschata]
MTAIFSNSSALGSMDIKHEMIYRDDDVLLVKSEPQIHSPCSTSSNGITVTNLLSSNICATSNGLVTTLAGSSALSASNGLGTAVSNNGLGAVGPFSGFGNTNVAVATVTPNKRPRTNDWNSPSPTTISVSVPPLTPSPDRPPSLTRYDPYSPNGKIGKYTQSTPYFNKAKC